jgi:superfamily II DNA or RNA helicase
MIPQQIPAPWPATNTLRAWQRRVIPAVLAQDQLGFLIEACPGAGKTIPALKIGHTMITNGDAARLVIVCPTSSLARQWAREAAKVGLNIEPNWAAGPVPRDCHGIAVTYQRIASGAELYRHGCREPTIVIADEPHHMGDNASWGRGFRTAFEPAVRWLLLSGTPFRSDSQLIPGVSYDDDGLGRPDFTYSYGEAVRDGVCRKITFVPFDGELSWSSDGTLIEATFADALDGRQAAYRHRTAVSTAAGDGLRRMLEDADKQLTWVREHGHCDAGGLVVACDIGHARRIAEMLRQCTGEATTIVVSDDPDATDRLERFRTGTSRWIVAVNMVSEGVDIPRLRVGVYATVSKTALLFRQIVGRFVRVTPKMPNDTSFLYIPADPVLLALAEDIERELRHDVSQDLDDQVSSPGDAEPPQTVSTFVALDARVQAQGALLSGLRCAGPEQAAAIDQLARDLGLEPVEVYQRVMGDESVMLPGPPQETEFERRERLRRERRRLVGRLHHATQRDYSEIQQWVNDAVANGRPVNENTVAELERGIRMLLRTLAGQGSELTDAA